MCVCVCESVREGERERENDIIVLELVVGYKLNVCLHSECVSVLLLTVTCPVRPMLCKLLKHFQYQELKICLSKIVSTGYLVNLSIQLVCIFNCAVILYLLHS